MGRYQQEYRHSLTEPDQYWGGAAKLIDWYTEPGVVLDRSDPPFYPWFTGGVPALPKTRSGKIVRKTMRGIADSGDEPMPSTIEDPAALDALRPLLYGD